MTNDWTGRSRTPGHVLRIAGLVALGVAAAIAVPQARRQDQGTAPPVPANLQVPAPNEEFLVGHAFGTQNYTCRPSPTIGQVAWALFTPQATLFDENRSQIITHYFGPNPVEGGTVIRAAWQHADTSTVWGRVVASSTDATFVEPGAIPWLLVQVVGAQLGPTGGDTLAKTTFIQRLNTTGGAAPSSGCDLPTDIGHQAFVPYTADYFFYRQ
jgi:Protein of unknown function (DUF3455)